MSENIRKNNSNRELVLPTSILYFTIQDVVKLNPEMLTASESIITIRVRFTKTIDDGQIAEIGSIPGGKGRPQKVFAFTPVTTSVLDVAEQSGVTLVDRAREKFVNVVSVKNILNTPPVPVNIGAPKSVSA